MRHDLHISKNSLKLKPSANYASTTESYKFFVFLLHFLTYDYLIYEAIIEKVEKRGGVKASPFCFVGANFWVASSDSVVYFVTL